MEEAREAIVLDVLKRMQNVSSWCGETHLQKTIFLLSALEDQKGIPFEFIMYKHGPYSFDLHDVIGELESSLLVERRATPPYGSRLQLTASGERALEASQRLPKGEGSGVDLIVQHFSVLSVAELERYATACYVNDEMGSASLTERVRRFRVLKPHISEESAINSFGRIQDYSEMRQR